MTPLAFLSHNPRRSLRRGFGVAPVLYMLGLIGVLGGTMFSNYMQTIKTGISIQNGLTVRNDLMGASAALAAQSMFSANNVQLCPPRSVHESSGEPCDAAPIGLIQFTDFPNTQYLPANYASAASTGSPVEVGVFAVGTNKQMDAFGHTYIYCRWENSRANPASPAFVLISAGPDGILQTKCGDTVAQGDDYMISFPVAEAITHASLWQPNGTTDVSYGAAGSQVVVDASGDLTAAGTITGNAGDFGSLHVTGASQLDGATTIGGLLTAGSSSLATTSVSSLTDSGDALITGNVGIGVTTPSQALTIDGNIFIQNSGWFLGTALNKPIYANSADYYAGLGFSSASGNGTASAQLYTNNIPRLTINSAGTVLFGTTTPTTGATFEINAGGAHNADLFYVGDATKGVTISDEGGGGDINATTSGLYLDNAFGGYPIFIAPNFTTNAHLSVGTLSTAHNLEINGTANIGATTVSSLSDTGTASLGVTSVTSLNNTGTLAVTGATTLNGTLNGSSATFSGNVTAASFTGAMSIGGSGVSFSGTLPIANGGTGASNAVSALANLGITAGGYLAIPLSLTGVSTGSCPTPTVAADGRVTACGSATASVAGTSGNVQFNNGGVLGGSSSFTWDATNNRLGIGTAAPDGQLEIYGTLPSVNLASSQNGEREYQFINDGNYVYIKDDTDATGEFRIRSNANTDVARFSYAAPSNSFYLSSNGNLGIGTSNPTTNLAVTVGTGNPVITVGPYAGNGGGTIAFTGSNNGVISTSYLGSSWTGGLELVAPQGFTVGTISNLNPVGGAVLQVGGSAAVGTGYIQTAAPTNGLIVQGSVGIGTTAPAYLLDVAGAAGASIRTISTSGSGNASLVLAGSYNSAVYSAVIQSGWTGHFDLWPGSDGTSAYSFSNAANNSVVMDIDTTNGRVGVGTTSPAYALDVAGNIQTKASQGGVHMVATGNNYNADLYQAPAGLYLVENSNAPLNITTLLSQPILFNTNNTEHMRLTSGGYLGIGTVTPQATLDINGFMRLVKNSSAPATCNTTNDGSLALTSNHTLCVCNGTTWATASDGSTTCTWVASSSPVQIVLSTAGAGTWTVPANWNSSNNKIEVVGAGAGGASFNFTSAGSVGGGGGAYSNITNLALTPGATINYSVGTGGTGETASAAAQNGGDTWFNATTYASASVAAKGGNAVSSGNTGGTGGAAASGIGTTKNSGGNGDNSGTDNAGAGGGGAAGPDGSGIIGVAGASGSSSSGGAGGAGDNGSGGAGGTGGTSSSKNGGTGTSGTISGGGGGGGYANGGNGGAGGVAGAGGGGGGSGGNSTLGGQGANGQIVITYTP